MIGTLFLNLLSAIWSKILCSVSFCISTVCNSVLSYKIWSTHQIASPSTQNNCKCKTNLISDESQNIDLILHEMKTDITTMTKTMIALHADFGEFFVQIRKVLQEVHAHEIKQSCTDVVLKEAAGVILPQIQFPSNLCPPPPPPPPPPPMPSYNFNPATIVIKKRHNVEINPRPVVPAITVEVLKQVKLKKPVISKAAKNSNPQNGPLVSMEMLRNVKLKSTKFWKKKSVEKKKPNRSPFSPRTRDLTQYLCSDIYTTPKGRSPKGRSLVPSMNPQNLLKKVEEEANSKQEP